MNDTSQFEHETADRIQAWLQGPYDEKTKNTIKKLLKENPQELADAFHTYLSFGTGGVRGIMGVGTNRLNIYTIRVYTQGIVNYLFKQTQTKCQLSVLIGYDSRHHSRQFAEECAKVFSGNQIKVLIFDQARPTPLVSYGCRYKKCDAGIMITASHNPPEYNGYKVFWNDGAQLFSPHDQAIVQEVKKIADIALVKSNDNMNNSLIEWIHEEVDQAYLFAIAKMQLHPSTNMQQGHSLKIVYTNLHGTGITLIPLALKQWGFSRIELVEKQVSQDGDFPSCLSPNPENPESLKLGMATLLQCDGDLLLATDPDADRVGVAVKHQGKIQRIDGNQMICLLVYYILNALTSQKRLPKQAVCIKSIVTSELFEKICFDLQTSCLNVLTGFKYFSQKIREWENSANGYEYIFGGEESCGYLYGTLVRDKDAILSSGIICEMALQEKLNGRTLIDLLHEIWKKYGTYVEKSISVHFKDLQKDREAAMDCLENLKKNPPHMIEGIQVEVIEDYSLSTRLYLKTGKTEEIPLPKANVLLFRLEDKSKIVIRPSGTEPKIKIYGEVVNYHPNIEIAQAEANQKAMHLVNYMTRIFAPHSDIACG